MILVVLVLRSSNSGSSGSTSSTTISSITTWGPYHGGGGPLTRNTKPYICFYYHIDICDTVIIDFSTILYRVVLT